MVDRGKMFRDREAGRARQSCLLASCKLMFPDCLLTKAKESQRIANHSQKHTVEANISM